MDRFALTARRADALNGGVEADQPDGISQFYLRLQNALAAVIAAIGGGGAAVAGIVVRPVAARQRVKRNRPNHGDRTARDLRAGNRPGLGARLGHLVRLLQPGGLRSGPFVEAVEVH